MVWDHNRTAKAKTKRSPIGERAGDVETRPTTGLYYPCGTGRFIHAMERFALTVHQGKRAFYADCPRCLNRQFLGPRWEAGMGLTRPQALEQGYVVL
jgi:hypothetical protein